MSHLNPNQVPTPQSLINTVHPLHGSQTFSDKVSISVVVTNCNACVTCHTCHTSVTDFRPKSGNPVEVTLVTSPKLYIVSHAKGTTSLSFNINLDTTSLSFLCLRQTW